MDSKFSKIMSIASAYPATSCSSRLANDLDFIPDSSFSTSRSLSFAPSMRVEDPYALDCGDALETGESLRGEGLHRLPAALKLIDIRDELQNLGRDGDVLNGVHCYI